MFDFGLGLGVFVLLFWGLFCYLGICCRLAWFALSGLVWIFVFLLGFDFVGLLTAWVCLCV